MSISSNVIINDENTIENIAIVLNAMKDKYKTELDAYKKDVLINVVNNFLKNSELMVIRDDLAKSDKEIKKLIEFNKAVVKILQRAFNTDPTRSIESYCERIKQAMNLYIHSNLKKLKFIEPKIENSSLLLNEDKKLYSSHFSLMGSTNQSGIFGCYMGDFAKRSLSIDQKNILDKNQIKENSTYINFKPSEANKELFLSAFKDTSKNVFYQEQDCNDNWIKINNSSKPLAAKIKNQQEPER